MLDAYRVFDSHIHIIDGRFPLIPNDGYLPPTFTCADYLERMSRYRLCGGAIVSGSFQGFDQSYLTAALQGLGGAFVGVTQLTDAVSDDEVVRLSEAGVRALRFNLKRGGTQAISQLSRLAHRVHEIARWHVEIYADALVLPDLYTTLIALPAVSIDHLGLSRAGFAWVVRLAEKGVRVKASGFGRVDFDVAAALKAVYTANPDALMFGSDLPSTRAPRPYSDGDFLLVGNTLGDHAARRVFSDNAIAFYQPRTL